MGEAVPLGEVRSRTLIGMMDRIVDSLDIHRQSRDQDFCKFARDAGRQNGRVFLSLELAHLHLAISLYQLVSTQKTTTSNAWLNLEASCVGESSVV